MASEMVRQRGKILMHRSVRHVSFQPWRFAFWLLIAAAGTAALVWHNEPLVRGYRSAVDLLLGWSGVPFEAGTGEQLGFIGIPSWQVSTFNPVASRLGLLIYAVTILVVLLLVWRMPGVPLPFATWVTSTALVLLLACLVLHWRPLPLLTPDTFSGLWSKVTIGTVLIFPCLWAILVGMLPLPVPRVALWGSAALVFFLIFNVVRLAFFLALARWAGAVWLPLAVVFGGTLPDCLMFITAFGFVMEKVGPAWDDLT